MNKYHIRMECGIYKSSFNKISMYIKRGKETNDFFIVVYGIILTIVIAVISVLDFYYLIKIALFTVFPIVLFLCFRCSRFRNLLVKFLNGIRDFKER